MLTLALARPGLQGPRLAGYSQAVSTGARSSGAPRTPTKYLLFFSPFVQMKKLRHSVVHLPRIQELE